MSQRDEKVLMYRRTFGTPWGRETLADILEDLGFMRKTEENDPGGVALLNQARRLLVNCGVEFSTASDRLKFVEAIMGIDPIYDDPVSTPKEG